MYAFQLICKILSNAKENTTITPSARLGVANLHGVYYVLCINKERKKIIGNHIQRRKRNYYSNKDAIK